MNSRTYRMMTAIGIIGLLGIVINYHNADALLDFNNFLNKTDSLMKWWTHWYSLTFVIYCLLNISKRKHWTKHDKWYSSGNAFIYIITLSIIEFFFTWLFHTIYFVTNGGSFLDWDLTFWERIPSSIIHIYVPIMFFVLFKFEKFEKVDHKTFNRKAFFICLIEPAAWVIWTTIRGFVIYSNGNYETSSDIMPYAPYLDLFWVWDIEGYSTPPVIFRLIWYVWCLVFMYWAGFGAFHWIIEANNRGYQNKLSHKKNSR